MASLHPPCPQKPPRQVSAQIDRIQIQFDKGHRRAQPERLVMAATVETHGVDDGLADELREIGNALEQHMFKAEIHSEFSVFRVPQLA